MVDVKHFSAIRREFENILMLVYELKNQGVSIENINKAIERTKINHK